MSDNNKDVPYIVFEGVVAHNARTVKRLVIALIIAIILIFASNAIWLYAWCQYDYESEEITYTQDGQGLNNINTGVQGGVEYGTETDSQEANEDTEK